MIGRRAVLGGGAAALLAGCAERDIPGGFTGGGADRGHLLRAPRPAGAPVAVRRTRVVIAGGGIAGLAAARALRQRGIEDFVLLELEDEAGGNSRAGALAGLPCPLGAHYLPVPGDSAREVQDLLEEFGLRQRVGGRWRYDERHLCHSPQERLYFQGHWQEGLLPVEGVGAGTLAQYRRFAGQVREAQRTGGFSIPMARRALTPAQHALAATTFAAWLDQHRLDDPHLRWYLDYCCRDDYGAGPATVSAWAGLHYFAARHGFHAPGDDGAGSGPEAGAEPVLAWPEGNGWLARRLAAPLGERLRTGRVVARIAAPREGVEVEALDVATGGLERWQAAQCIVALPVFVAARVVENAPPLLRARAAATRYAPWVVVNLHLDAPLRDVPGAPPAWDNVVYGSGGLGYVDAGHQGLDPRPRPTVLTWYLAPGEAARADLLGQPWTAWRDRALADLAAPHPDLAERLTRVSVTRHGHAMAIPVPGPLVPWPAAPRDGRLVFAHADWAGYSVFEEAFTLGHLAGSSI